MSSGPEWAKPEVGDDYLLAIGAVAYWSGAVEGRLFWLAAAMVDNFHIGDDPTDQAIAATSGLSFASLCQLLTRLLDLRGKDSHPTVRATIRRAEIAMRDRNQIVHGEWWDDEGEEALALTYRSWKKIEVIDFELVQVQELATQLSEISRELLEAKSEIFPPYAAR